MKVDGDFEVEYGRISFNTKAGKVVVYYLFEGELGKKEQEGLRFPATYCFMLINRETREEAEKLLCEALNLNLMPFATHTLCNTAYEKSFEEAWKLLEEFKREKPEPGKFRFYIGTKNPIHVSRDLSLPEVSGIDITDGKKFFRVSYTGPTDHLKRLGLPVNVYAEAKETPVELESSEETRKLVKKNPESVFNLVERLTIMNTEQKGFSRNIVTGGRLQRIFETYLEDERKGFKLLREAEKGFRHKFEREKVWERLWKEAPVEVKGVGYIISIGRVPNSEPTDLYFVTSDGVAYLLGDRWATVDIREEVLRLVVGGEVPKNLKEVKDPEVLREIAKKLVPIDPALVNVVMP